MTVEADEENPTEVNVFVPVVSKESGTEKEFETIKFPVLLVLIKMLKFELVLT